MHHRKWRYTQPTFYHDDTLKEVIEIYYLRGTRLHFGESTLPIYWLIYRQAAKVTESDLISEDVAYIIPVVALLSKLKTQVSYATIIL
jgi:hypothetical protein